MSGFTKLFESILDSSVWDLDDQTVRVWIAMMALADLNGEVHNTIPGLARRAKVSIEACEAALEAFMSPDKYSRTKAHDGRRIEAIDEGWRLLNHPKYRRMFSQEEQREKTARRTREWRDRETQRQASRAVTERHGASPAVTNDASDDKQRQRQIQNTEADHHHQDLKNGQDRAQPAPPVVVEFDEREMPCPLDVEQRAEAAGIFSELATSLRCSEAALRAEANAFASYWTIGGGMGRKRRHWLRILRQRLVDRAKAGELPRVDPTNDPVLKARAERRAVAMKAADDRKIAELNERAAKHAGATIMDLKELVGRIGN